MTSPDWEQLRDPAPDPEIAALLRETESESPTREVDWDGLHAAIRERAELPLTRLRRDRGKSTRHWWVSVLPAGLAAAAAVLLFALLRGPTEPTTISPIAAADSVQLPTLRPMMEEVLGASLSPAEYELLITEDVTAEALVIAAVDAR